MKINRLLGAIIVILLITGCQTTPPKADALPSEAISEMDWQGTWAAVKESFYGHDSPQALILRPGGTGEIITSDIFVPQKGEHWVASTSITWQIVSPSTVNLTLLQTKTLHGDGRWGWGAKKTGTFPLKSTQAGLRTEVLGLKDARFQNVSKRADAKIAGQIIAEVKQSMQSGQMAGSNENSANKNAGLFLAGAGLGAAAAGNLEMAQQLLNQASSTYSGTPLKSVSRIGEYDPGKYFTGGNSKAKETMGRPAATDAQLREAYPDGKAWDVTFLNGSIWKKAYGVDTATKNRMLEQGNAVIGGNIRNRNAAASYTPYSGMKVGMEAINPP